MPQLGLEVTEGVVTAIHVAGGARVAEGDVLLELETDKALTDVVAPRDGVTASIEVQVGDTVEVGDTLVILADDVLGEDERTAIALPPSSIDAPPPESVDGSSAVAADDGVGDGQLRAAPVARRAAERLGVSLSDVVGTGPRGRITLKDVEQHASMRGPTSATDAVVATTGDQLEALNPVRRAVARRMTQSQQIPQFALQREIDATWLLAEKQRLQIDFGVKASVNDLLIQALAETVIRHPGLGLAYVEAERDGAPPRYRRREGVDVGLAVATDRGLLVPVIRAVHIRPLHAVASERVRLVDAARTAHLALEEMGGATITLSSLAGFGVDSFVAMLNPGESAILAVGRVVDRVVARGGQPAIAPTLALALTIDHRVMDGASGGTALVELAELLEGGMLWRP